MRSPGIRSARLELVDRARHNRFVHLRDFETLADAVQQRDVQFAAQVLAELAKALDHGEAAAGRSFHQRTIPEPESDAFEQRENAIRDDRREVALLDRIGHVERDPDGDGLAVAQPMTRHRLQLMGGPVAEIQRTRAAQLERIAVAADVRQVQFGRAANQRREHRDLAVGDLVDVRFEIA